MSHRFSWGASSASRSNQFCRLALCASVAWAALSAPALAQTTPAEEREDVVVITGTQIRGIAPIGAPVVGLSNEDIEETGYLDTASVLKTVPQISYLGISESTTGTTANGNGTNTTFGTGVNIHGLGQQATLTLINGHRGAPGGQFGNYFEPSNVPTIALGGIEVLTDGASAIYGSDAMAGVVNLILRKDYDGAEVRASYGVADDYETTDFSAVVGRTWDTGSFMLAGQRYWHSNLMASDRPDLFIADGPSVFSGNGALPRGFTNFTANPNIRTGSGASTAYYAGPRGATSLAQFTPNAQNIQGQWYASSALPKTSREALVLNFDQDLSEDVTLYGQGFWSQRRWEGFGHVSGSFTGVQSTLTVPSTNPYFITGVPGAATSQTVLLSQAVNLGLLTFNGREQSWQGVVGLTWDFLDDWQLDLNAQRTANRVARLRSHATNTCGLTGGSQTACILPAGHIAAANGNRLGTIGQTNPALAFNPFGASGASVLDLIDAADLQEGYYDSDIITAKADGPLFSLPGGQVRAAFGVEYREDTEGQFNTTETTAPITGQFIQLGSNKSMTVKSAFAEVVIPIVGEANAMPGIQRLDLSVAGRYADYDILSDSTSNPKIGVTWEPIDDLAVSASYATSFRVNLASTDSNNAPLLRIRTINDFRGTGGTANAIQRGGGNPSLAPEESETYTLSLDWTPSQIDGLKVNVSYFDISYEGVIDTPGAAVLNSITANSEAIYGAYITRRPSTLTPGADDTAFNAQVAAFIADPLFQGAVVNPVNVIIDARSQNAGVIETDGFDFSVTHEWESGFGQLNAGLSGIYFLNYKRSLTPTGALVDRLDQIDFPQQYRLRGELGWSNDAWSATLFANYTPSYTNTYPTPVRKVGSYLTFDLNASYDFGEMPGFDPLKNVRLSLSAQNLLDDKPPFAAIFDQNFDSSITSMLGRVVTVQLSKGF